MSWKEQGVVTVQYANHLDQSEVPTGRNGSPAFSSRVLPTISKKLQSSFRNGIFQVLFKKY